MRCAQTAEPIEMLFGIWTPVGPRNHVLGYLQSPTWMGNFEGWPNQDISGTWYTQWLSSGQHWYGEDADRVVLDGVHIGATWRLRLNRPCEAVMRPYDKLLWPVVYLQLSVVWWVHMLWETQPKLWNETVWVITLRKTLCLLLNPTVLVVIAKACEQ